jgi:hypothetical protein
LGLLGRTIPKPSALAVNGGVWFQAGTVQLHIGAEESFTPARKAHPRSASPASARTSSRSPTAAPRSSRAGNLPGHLRFYSHDPFGNSIEFLEPLPEPASETDSAC